MVYSYVGRYREGPVTRVGQRENRKIPVYLQYAYISTPMQLHVSVRYGILCADNLLLLFRRFNITRRYTRKVRRNELRQRKLAL